MNNTLPASFTHGSANERYVVAAERVFDGTRVLEQHAVAVSGDRIAAVAPVDRLRDTGRLIRFAGTLLPGFIDLHAHLLFDQTPQETILRHGLTTVRDTGGPLVPPSGGDGRLRVLGAGPILTAPGGYPIPVFGGHDIACEVPDVQTARAAVGQHVAGGAALIKDPIPHDLVARAAAAGVRVVSTLDTQSHCTGVANNARQLVEAGILLLYGTDLAHTDVPWGIDAQELLLMLHAAHGALTPLDVLSAATARAGEHLGLAPLGQLVEGAPADFIGVRGNPLERFKLLEYPDLVVSGGVTIVAPVEH